MQIGATRAIPGLPQRKYNAMTIKEVKTLADTTNRLAAILGNGKILRVAKATLIEDAHPRLVLANADATMVIVLTERTSIEKMDGDVGWVLYDEAGESFGVLDIL